ncbi:murein hydrolase activator EnvC family protein [Microbacterium sp.]|uniref:murein hydrolase activator EnvC family protein n=1 Tax=Microbacterium sp. TaxID=51671 RepID=UPI0028123FE5|nr:M23 family metallopeptidase [Microbacterium sp.]
MSGNTATAGGRPDARRRAFRACAVIGAVVLLAGSASSDAVGAAAPPPLAASGTLTPQGAASGKEDSGASSAPGFPWTWPVGGPRTVISPFRAPAHDYGPGHRGMDVAASAGATVRAPADGIVAFRGVVVDRPLITIEHGRGYVTTLEPVSSELSPGEAVAAGEEVGRVATGGHAAAGTLHVGVRIDGDYVNPRGLFGDIPRAVLLPCCAG